MISNLFSTQNIYDQSNFYLRISQYLNPKFYFNQSLLAENYYLNKNNEYFEHASSKFIKDNFGLYGCERASSFFEKDGQYYRLFLTTPNEKADVAYVGIENIFKQYVKEYLRYIIIFFFGLLHGLGFASVLSSFGLPNTNFVWALVGFNIGVEIGQITLSLIHI